MHGDARTPTALIPFRSQNLIVVRAQRLTNLGPRIEMVTRRNRAANPLRLPDTPKLLERSCAIDRGLVCAGGLVDVVSPTVRRDSALLGCSRRRVVGAVRLDNVVLDEGVAGPAVEGDVRVYVGGVPCACDVEVSRWKS